MLALHFGPVRSEVPAPETMNTLFFCAATWLTASATPEFGTSMIMSTLSTSNHWLAMLRADVGLVLVVAETISTLTFGWSLMKSATAILAAATEPGPPMSA